MKVIIFKSKKNKQWYFHIVGSNGKVIAQSEGYTRRSNCGKTVSSLKRKLAAAKTETLS